MVISIFCGICLIALADRGGFIRKNKTHLNITTAGNLKNSIRFNLKSDLNYRGCFFINQKQVGRSLVSDALISYKKGNSIYLLPYKQKILIPEYTQGEGYKLIIRSRK